MRIHWSGASRFHDWSAGGRAIPRRMLTMLREAGAIGEVEWVEEAPDDLRRPASGPDVLDLLLDRDPRPGRTHGFNAGGSRPAAWEVALLLPPWIEEDGQARGYNLLGLWFEDDAFSGVAGSDRLAAAFRSIHGPADTETARIHPADRWSELTDTLGGAYGSPVTFAPLFPGVAWATFLGRGHLELFDLRALQALQAHEVAWDGEEGLFLRVSADVRDAVTPEVEREMLGLTERMRGALR